MEKLSHSRNINYNFIAVPTNLFFSLDGNLRNGLTVLLQLQSVFGDADGYFFRTNEDLQSDFRMGKNLTIAVLESLYQYGLLQVKSVGFTKKNGKRSVNFFRVNVERFKDFEKFNIYTITNNEELHLDTVNYKANDFKVTYTATTEEISETAGNTPQIVSNEISEETPSIEAENTTTTRETANSDLVEFQTVETACVIPTDINRVEKRSLDKVITNQAESYQTANQDCTKQPIEAKRDETTFNQCIQLLKQFDALTDVGGMKHQENLIKDFVNSNYDKGLLDLDTKGALMDVLDQLKADKLPF